ncbi:serine hydrolase domain-containing protein [Candidatus Foliamicus sp.]
MRRIAIFVGAAAVIAALAVALFVDWRFWYRWYTLPEDPGEWPASYYQPVVEVPGNPGAFFAAAEATELTIDAAALEAAADWAEQHNSAALIVLHRGVIQIERYWQGIGPESLFTGRAMTRSLLPPLVAIAMQEGAIESLDAPVGNYLPEWAGDPRGRITIRQLLQNLSGLENPPLAEDPDPYNKNTQISLSSDFRKAALAFDLENAPGEFFAFSNANAQLLGAVLESATREQYEDYLNSRLWLPLGAGPAQLYMDRQNGMPAVYCCFRATPRDWLRYGAALLGDGEVDGRRIWPAGWVGEMTTGSGVNPGYGYQIWVGNPPDGVRRYVQDRDQTAPHGPPIEAAGAFFLEGGGFRTMYVVPGEQLVILRLGYFHPDWRTSTLPNLILAGLQN